MARMKETITAKLQAGLSPTALDVVDESHLHAGHGGWREGGETHFRLRIASPAFAGKSRIAKHRLIHTLLADELAGGVHALAIETHDTHG